MNHSIIKVCAVLACLSFGLSIANAKNEPKVVVQAKALDKPSLPQLQEQILKVQRSIGPSISEQAGATSQQINRLSAELKASIRQLQAEVKALKLEVQQLKAAKD